MSDTYEKLVRARAANVALQHLVNEHREALLALIAQPFSPACIAQAKAVASTPIDTALAEQHCEEFMALWRQVNGDEGRDTLFDSIGRREVMSRRAWKVGDVAILEDDCGEDPPVHVRILRLLPSGEYDVEALPGQPINWGRALAGAAELRGFGEGVGK